MSHNDHTGVAPGSGLDMMRDAGYCLPMIDPKLLDEFSQHLSANLPMGVRALQEDIGKHLRTSLEAAFARLELVTREEFDIQSAVLARTREKLTRLEQQVNALEAQLEESGK